MKKHLIDYPPRRTACGLYYPKNLCMPGFGTYEKTEVTCKRCLRSIGKERSDMPLKYLTLSTPGIAFRMRVS